MKNKIKQILSKNSQISNLNGLIFEKENDILSCIKSANEEGIKIRQKRAANSLLDLKNQKVKIQEEINELLKSLDIFSFQNKKVSKDLTILCIRNGIPGESFKKLKQLYLNL